MTEPRGDSTGEKLLRAIRRDVEADGPRLKYADWIANREPERAEFIRVQCALAGLEPCGSRYWSLKERELDLLAAHGPRWREPLRALLGDANTTEITLSRGLAGGVVRGLSWSGFHKIAKPLVRLAPGLSVIDLRCETEQLVRPGSFSWESEKFQPAHGSHEVPPGLDRLGIWNQISDLSLSIRPVAPCNFTLQQVAKVLKAGDWPQLRRLALTGTWQTLTGQRALARCAAWKALRDVSLDGSGRVGDFRDVFPEVLRAGLRKLHLECCDGADKLFCSGAPFRSLESLRVANCNLTDESIADWARSSPFRSLRELDLSSSRLTARGIRNALGAPWASNVERLTLDLNPAGDMALSELARSRAALSVRELTFGSVGGPTPGEPKAVQSLEAVREFCRTSAPQLWRLDWGGEKVTAGHVRAIIEAPWWPQLRSLRVSTEITLDAARLLGGNWPPELERLEMVCGTIGDECLHALLPSRCRLTHLRALWLIHCGLSGRSLLHLAEDCEFPRLLELGLTGNKLGGFADFVASPLAKNLRIFSLEDAEEISISGFEAMLNQNAFPRLSEVSMDGVDHEVEFVFDRLDERFGDRIRL